MLGEVLVTQKVHEKDDRLERSNDPSRCGGKREEEGLVDLCQDLLFLQVWETRG